MKSKQKSFNASWRWNRSRGNENETKKVIDWFDKRKEVGFDLDEDLVGEHLMINIRHL